MYGVSEYLTILAGLEEVRLADRSRKENLPDRKPATREEQAHLPDEPEKVTRCP